MNAKLAGEEQDAISSPIVVVLNEQVKEDYVQIVHEKNLDNIHRDIPHCKAIVIVRSDKINEKLLRVAENLRGKAVYFIKPSSYHRIESLINDREKVRFSSKKRKQLLMRMIRSMKTSANGTIFKPNCGLKILKPCT